MTVLAGGWSCAHLGEVCLHRASKIVAERCLPLAIRCDNGPERTSRHFPAWALECKIDLIHIQPRKPTHNAYLESFNSKQR
jgi:putative transposase